MKSNPYLLAQSIEATLKRYIPTTLNISRNYPRLRQRFRELLAEQVLVKGPYVEALPDFEKGATLRTLLRKNGGFLHDGLEDLPDALLDRPLHRHQAEALDRACKMLESFLAATGTGSGKTEMFLYPIIHMLLDDPESRAPGVRALIIYPMNALANDQLFYRIAPLLGRWLARHHLTFGRYTSQIRAKAKLEDEQAKLETNDRLMDALGGEIPRSWLVTREQMLESPPKVLLTNYAMLEHLLLLPRNAPLFAQSTLRCIVLDEIHTYTGAQATEVAFLLRKLKNRLKLDRPVQVFGTSASLNADPGSDAKLLNFAADLFGEPVHGVIRGKRMPHAALSKESGKNWTLSADRWQALGGIVREYAQRHADDREDAAAFWNEQLKGLGYGKLSVKPDEKPGPAMLRIFQNNKEVRKTAELLGQGAVVEFDELAKGLFSKAEPVVRIAALNAVIQAGTMARASEDAFPLLPARYHLAANGIEGMCVSLDAESDEGWGEMRPFRNGVGPDGQPYYPLLVCRRCGQPFVEGFHGTEKLSASMQDDGSGSRVRKVFWLGKPRGGTLDEADEDVPAEETPKKSVKGKAKAAKQESVIHLDPKTGAYCGQDAASVALQPVATHQDSEERKIYVRVCPACGGRASGGLPDIVTTMHPGYDAMGAVVCQHVLDVLPPDPVQGRFLPLGGRNLLTFSDNRQDAAYFAPYFEQTSNDFALRSAVYQILKDDPDEAYGFDELAEVVLKRWRKSGSPVIVDGTGKVVDRKNKQLEVLTGHLAAEFCTPGGRRTSLEALGAVQVVYEERALQVFIRALSQAMPSHQEQAEALAGIFLEHIRRERAITTPANGNVDMTDAVIWGEYCTKHRAFERQRSQNSELSHAWMPGPDSKRHNRRTWYLVERLGWTWEQVRDVLNTAWEAMGKAKLLVPLKPGFGLDEQKIRVRHGLAVPLARCRQCGLAYFHHLVGKCPAFRCTGELALISDQNRTVFAKENHYLYMFEHSRAETLRAREHTAVLSQDVRQEIEADFSSRKLNLLSCTTTMEMGVDLGELEAIVCLNMPPGVSNYQQRTGRAGRRAQAAPFCVTLARGSRYDQSVFQVFREYLQTPAPTPRVHIFNAQLLRRHQFSILLSGFLRLRIADTSINAPSLKDFLAEEFNRSAYREFVEAAIHWLDGPDGVKRLAEAENLLTLLPPDCPQGGVGLTGTSLRNAFVAALERFASTILERCETYYRKRDEYAAQKEYQKAGHWEKQAERFMDQFLVNRLALNGLIPTYSFPINSLTLEVVREQKAYWSFDSSEVSLTRDAALGISEYAPGSRVVANGRVWTSSGLTYSPRQFMPERVFKVCPKCHHVEVREERSDLAGECPFCGHEKRGMPYAFIEPVGFMTEYQDRNGANPAQVRPRKIYADEARLISQARDKDFAPTGHSMVRKALLPAVGSGTTEAGTMFVVNRGPYGYGFHRCSFCNRMEPATKVASLKKKHDDIRTGMTCKSSQLTFPVCLAHTFSTDIIIFRFLELLPNLSDTLTSKGDKVTSENMAVTLAEALRFAAVELLRIQDSELRATVKLRGDKPDVILYDAIPGGAGYTPALMETNMAELLAAAVRKLRCPVDCDTACRACLCDYSNQMRWDSFQRKPVLAWLEKLLGRKEKSPVPGAEPWPASSLEGLRRRLESFPEIHLIGQNLLSGDTEPDGEPMTWLKSHLDAKRTVFCHLRQPKPYQPKTASPSERACWNHLRPYIQDGRLILTKLESAPPNLPRIFAAPSPKAPAFYSGYGQGALLDEPLPQPAHIALMSSEAAARLAAQIQEARQHPPTMADEAAPVVHLLAANKPRELVRTFSALDKAHVEQLVVEDPYCGLRPHRPKLFQIVQEIGQLAAALQKLVVICREPHYNDPHWQTRTAMQAELLNGLKTAGCPEETLSIRVLDFRAGKKLHDRSLKATVITEDGSSQTLIYDLSGGIDYLMDITRETKVYEYLREE